MAQNRHEALGLTDEEAIDMYRHMLLSRRIDERMWLLNRAGKISFVVSCQGQEAAQVGASFALDRDKDYVAPYYRDVGIVLAFGMTAKELMLFAFGKAEDPNSGGRQMPGHFGQKKNRILSQSSPVTTHLPHIVGIALAAKMDKQDMAFFATLGDGSANQGDFHEGLNFAGVHQLPVITMIENNQYAISVPASKQYAGETLSARAEGYGMHGVTIDGNDPLAVYHEVKKARERGMSGNGPTLIEAMCYRLTGHSSDDDDSQYRENSEVEEAKKNDGIFSFAAYLRETGIMTESIEQELEQEIDTIVNEATDYAEEADYPELASIYNYVYEEM